MEMFRRIPDIQPRLIGLLTDRVRESTRNDQQQEKPAALGKLSAGLAHELNNPASAVRRSTAGLREAIATLRQANVGLCREDLSDQVLLHLAEVEHDVAEEMTWLACHGRSGSNAAIVRSTLPACSKSAASPSRGGTRRRCSIGGSRGR